MNVHEKIQYLIYKGAILSTFLIAFVLIPLMIYITSDSYTGWIPDILLMVIMFVCVIPYVLYVLYSVIMLICSIIKDWEVFLVLLGYGMVGSLFLACLAFLFARLLGHN